jgi:hypothetical protein
MYQAMTISAQPTFGEERTGDLYMVDYHGDLYGKEDIRYRRPDTDERSLPRRRT